MENQSQVYNNGEIIVTFNSCLCIHAGNCTKRISSVVKTSKLPWINSISSKTRRMIRHIKKCPSGALQFDYLNN
jgi:uncharacterized Fe-S cluster protein YjdI